MNASQLTEQIVHTLHNKMQFYDVCGRHANSIVINNMRPWIFHAIDQCMQSTSGMVLMPCELTAENGAKALLAGEFCELIELPNPDYDPEDHDDDQEPEFVTQAVPVSWTTIKAIYAVAVKHFAERDTNNATT